MLQALLCPLLLAIAAEDPPRPVPPDAATVLAAVQRLDKAFLPEGLPAERVLAVRESSAVLHPDVITRIGKALRDADAEVQKSAVAALGSMRHPAALAELTELAKKDKALRKDEVLYPEVLKAIGRHADPSSVKLLADGPLGSQPYRIDQARILSLGNIRTRESVEELVQLVQSLGPGRAQPYLADVRLALAALTGADRGPSREQWTQWWNEHKKGLEIAPERAEMPLELERRWNLWWGEDPAARRDRKRNAPPETPAKQGSGGGAQGG